MSEKITENSINEKTLSKNKLSDAIKSTHKDKKSKSNTEMEEKLFFLGSMPPSEINGLVVNELEETFNLDRVKKLWIPKSQKMNELLNSDPQLLDEEKLENIIKDLDSKYSEKIEEIENKLKLNPFWQANKHFIKMVKIDELIVLQNSVNLDRSRNLVACITKDATIEQLLDYNFNFDRVPPQIHNHIIANNAVLFSSDDHDVRPGKIEVRKIQKHENGVDDKVSALIIPVVEGDPFVYCIKTHAPFPMPDGTTKMIHFLTLQNGIHRAYALRSLGIEYMPCLIIEPVTAGETGMLMGNWTPERLQQSVSPRPPLMKDFFNSELTEKFQVRKRLMCVKIEWKIEKFTT